MGNTLGGRSTRKGGEREREREGRMGGGTLRGEGREDSSVPPPLPTEYQLPSRMMRTTVGLDWSDDAVSFDGWYEEGRRILIVPSRRKDWIERAREDTTVVKKWWMRNDRNDKWKGTTRFDMCYFILFYFSLPHCVLSHRLNKNQLMSKVDHGRYPFSINHSKGAKVTVFCKSLQHCREWVVE